MLTRLYLLVLGAALVWFGWHALTGPLDPQGDLVRDAFEDLAADAGPRRFVEALRQDTASPQRWADLAEALLHAKRPDEARYCISRAVALGPRLPPVLLRAMNFYLLTDDRKGAREASEAALRAAPGDPHIRQAVAASARFWTADQ
ncbi:MAG: hypothetical protein ABIZ80_05235 [Bryobacteraceae bacterium]